MQSAHPSAALQIEFNGTPEVVGLKFKDVSTSNGGNYTVEIQSNGSVVAMYNGFEGEALPEEYSFTYNNTTEGEAFETIAYLYENYGEIINLSLSDTS